MNYKNFNRHEIFNLELMDFHGETINLVEDYCMENEISRFNEVSNGLMGIWDGFLYDGLADSARELGLSDAVISRIETTVKLIEDHITLTPA